MGKLEILEGALREEKDVNVYTRVLAVRLVVLGNSTASANRGQHNATHDTVVDCKIR